MFGPTRARPGPCRGHTGTAAQGCGVGDRAVAPRGLRGGRRAAAGLLLDPAPGARALGRCDGGRRRAGVGRDRHPLVGRAAYPPAHPRCAGRTAADPGTRDARRLVSRSGSPRAERTTIIRADARLASPPIQATGSLAGDHGCDCADGAAEARSPQRDGRRLRSVHTILPSWCVTNGLYGPGNTHVASAAIRLDPFS
jgi:hypothetical protein